MSILGAPDLAVKLGSLINLTCVISHTADQLQFIFWYRNERMINYDISNEKRGKIVLSKWHNATGKHPQSQDTISSNLQIHSSRLSDSGNYTCQPSGARSASVYLHVLEGKFPGKFRRDLEFEKISTNVFIKWRNFQKNWYQIV